jgi:glycosyltransferase involved in cell wall biosynthesis
MIAKFVVTAVASKARHGPLAPGPYNARRLRPSIAGAPELVDDAVVAAVAWNLVHIITRLELGGAQLATLCEVERSRFPAGKRFLLYGPGGMLDAEANALRDITCLPVFALQRPIAVAADARALAELRHALVRCKAGAPAGRWLVHTHSSKAGILGRFAARFAGVDRIVHSIHGFGHRPQEGRLVHEALLTAEQLAAQVTDGVTADSQANLTQAEAEGIIFPSMPAMVVRCGIDVAAFTRPRTEPAVVRASLGIPVSHRVVVSVACLKPQKDPATYVRVAARVIAQRPETTFLLAGDGELRPTVEAMAAELGLGTRFKLLGWRRDVADLLHMSDLFMLTSLWEGLPQALAQALAAGLPIVATDVDGAPEAVRHGESGFLAPAGAVDELARHALSLLGDESRRRAMGARGRESVGEFSVGQMLEDLDAFYAKVTSTRPRHGAHLGLAWRQLSRRLGVGRRRAGVQKP